MPEESRLRATADALRARFGDDVLIEASLHCGQACVQVDPARIVSVLGFLRDDPDFGFKFLASVHGCDYMPSAPRLGVHYELLNMRQIERLRVKVRLPIEDAQIESCVGLFPTADFQEREIYDMFGVVFTGHPDLRRILMPEDYEGFPQRRDFPLGGEPVIFTHNEPEAPGWYE